MNSMSDWNAAMRPNYFTNKNLKYPYSEVPYVGQYHLLRIPLDDELVPLVDYWGEGRIVSEQGTSGFVDSYNINHQYQLVSNGPDTRRKIPNRIPTLSYFNCSTGSYIINNSVRVVTVMGAPINKSCATDIARMVHEDRGRVIAYGFDETSADIKNLEKELTEKNLVFCTGYEVEPLFKEPTLYGSYRSYLNATDMKNELCNCVNAGSFDRAVKIIKLLWTGAETKVWGAAVVQKLIESGMRNTVDFAHKLWEADSKDIVSTYFPAAIIPIIQESVVKITSKQNNMNLKLTDDTQWSFKPTWKSGRLLFKLRNVKYGMFVGLEDKPGDQAERKAWGQLTTDDNPNLYWFLEPLLRDGEVLFVIINNQYRQGLSYGMTSDAGDARGYTMSYGDGVPAVYGWSIAPWVNESAKE